MIEVIIKLEDKESVKRLGEILRVKSIRTVEKNHVWRVKFLTFRDKEKALKRIRSIKKKYKI